MSQNKKQRNNYINGSRITDWIIYIYVIIIFGIYPLIMDRAYFNITITRYKFFMFATCLFIVFIVIGYFVDGIILDYYGKRQNSLVREQLPFYQKPEFWMEAFLMANVFAFVVSPNKSEAFTGENGRYMGLFIYIVMAVMFLLIAMHNKVNELLLSALFLSALFAFIVAIGQHLDCDFMHYKDGIAKKQFDIFMSTMGNINIFASFLAVVIPVFLCVFVFSSKLIYRIFASVILLLGGMVLMIANSDSAYLGVAAAVFMVFLLAYWDGHVRHFVLALLLLAAGNLGVVLLNRYVLEDYDKRGGVAEALDRLALAAAIVFALAAAYCLIGLINARFGTRLERLNKRKVICIFLGVAAACGAAVIFYGIHAGASLFTFNYEWGTYRGYIWTKCGELFADAPIRNKLFGYGNETLKSLMVGNYNAEMVKVTGKVYDNAHNELLQYLVTTGIAGLVSYLGLFVSSFVYILKRADKQVIAYISLAAVTGYFIQGLINLNQPITTPFYFVFMAIGVGFVRQKSNVGEYGG